MAIHCCLPTVAIKWAIRICSRKLAGTSIQHIPYKGAGPAVQDLLGGQVDLFFTTPASVVSHIKAEKLKGLVVTSGARLASSPQVPTSKEADLKEFTIDSWFALHAPAGTLVDYMNPTQLGEYTKKELDYWGRVIRSAKITAE